MTETVQFILADIRAKASINVAVCPSVRMNDAGAAEDTSAYSGPNRPRIQGSILRIGGRCSVGGHPGEGKCNIKSKNLLLHIF